MEGPWRAQLRIRAGKAGSIGSNHKRQRPVSSGRSDPRTGALATLRRVHGEIAELDPSGEDDSVTRAMEIVFRHIEELERWPRDRR